MLRTWSRKEAAEFLGTFFLTAAVALNSMVPTPVVPTVVLAAVVLGVCVYTLGGLSGCHLNPAITLGILSVGKIDLQTAVRYWIAQFAAAVVTMLFVWYLVGERVTVDAAGSGFITVMEALGTFVLGFGVASVVHGVVPSQSSGLVIGGSLFAGVMMTAGVSLGVLNPAVAVAAGVWHFQYLLAPFIGGVLGFQVASALFASRA